MRLRPHHLLCTQAYEGKGYSENFVLHMNGMVERLRTQRWELVELALTTDDICAGCPKRLGENLCQENDSVLEQDQKVLEVFGLTEGSYRYSDLIEEIRSRMTPELLEKLCGSCSWYPVSRCRELLLP